MMLDFEYFNDLLVNLSTEDQEQLREFIQTVAEIKTNSTVKADAYTHLMLREKYFVLIQTVVDVKNELFVKFAFKMLEKFCQGEMNCAECSAREKAQFVLNIMRFIEHTHIENDISKMETLKFLLNNHEAIGQLLNTKILLSLSRIALNENESPNRFIQSQARTLMVKYTAVVCNKINFMKSNETESVEFDFYLVSYFEFLLNTFNDDGQSYELRVLMLECIELLLNNLIAESNEGGLDLTKNKAFIKFAWQTFCPSILCQFSDSNCSKVPSSNSSQVGTQKMPFKQVYTLLLQLTGLIGNCREMIPVFEAIYQRILVYPPDQDRNLLLKLFKAHVNKEFVFKLTRYQSYLSEATLEDPATEAGDRTSSNKFSDFTLINLIVEFYRNCYEKSVKEPEDKILKFLSCECICSYVELINSLYKSFMNSSKDQRQPTDISVEYKLNKRPNSLNNFTSKSDMDKEKIQLSSKQFFETFCHWLKTLATCDETQLADLDLTIKKLSVNFIRTNSCPFLTANTYYATIYFSLNEITRYVAYFNSKEDNLDYFKSRIIPYNTSVSQNSPELNEWLSNIFNMLHDYKQNPQSILSGHFLRQLKFISSQMDCDFNCRKSMDGSKFTCSMPHSQEAPEIELVKNLLQSTWTYLVDVLTGYILNTKLDSLEEILFFKQAGHSPGQFDISNDMVTDISFKLVAFKSCLDSLHTIQCILSNLKSMDRELSQILLILGSDWFSSPTRLGEEFGKTISLNQLVCFDFMLFSACRIVCDLNSSRNNKSTLEKSHFALNNHTIFWKNLIEIYFAVIYLQANIDHNIEETTPIKPIDTKQRNKLTGLISQNNHLFRSVYFNRDELSIFNKDETDNFEHNSKLMGTTTFRAKNTMSHSLSFSQTQDDSTNLVKFAKIKYQQEIIVKTLFLFANANDKLISDCAGTKNSTNKNEFSAYILNLTKRELIDALANRISGYLNDKLFDLIDTYMTKQSSPENDESLLGTFDYIWSFVFYSCQFSKRFLLQANTCHEYYTLNNLIIDKLDDALMKLFEKFSYSTTVPDAANFEAFPSLLLPGSSKQHNSKPYSMYSIFILELWFNVLIDYLLSVLKKSDIFQTKRNMNVGDKLRTKLVDLSLCKKLISLVQKCIEAYLNVSASSVSGLCPSDLLHQRISQAIEIDSANGQALNKNTKMFLTSFLEDSSSYCDSDVTSQQLLVDATTSMILGNVQAKNSELSRIDELCNFNDIFLLPFKYLMESKKLDSHLQDTVLISLRVLIECKSIQLKTSWNSMFTCLAYISLKSKNYENLKKLANKTKDPSSLSLDLEMSPVYEASESEQYYSDSSESSASFSTSEASDSSESETDDCNWSFGTSFRPSLRFDSYRIRLISLLEIFEIYLNQAYNSTYLLENGSFEFIKCIAHYLQYSGHIKVYDPVDYVFQEPEVTRALTPKEIGNSEKETSYISAYECNLEEFHYQITSNFEQLCELVASKHLSSSIKPFLGCLEKLFNTIVTRVILKPDISSDKPSNYLLTQPLFLLENYHIKEIKPLPLLKLFNYFDLKNYSLIDISANGGCIEFESNDECKRLNTELGKFLGKHDPTSTFKLLVYLIESLATRLCLTQDGLNCVQLALQIDSLLNQLIDREQYVLVGYVLLEVIFKNIVIQIDYIEANRSKEVDSSQKILNDKLKENQFFLSNFMGNRIESSFGMFIRLLEALDADRLKSNQDGALLRLLTECNLNRSLAIITTSLVRKLSNFDSLTKFTFGPVLKDLIGQFNRLNETGCAMKCVRGVKRLHSLTLMPFHILTAHYKDQVALSKGGDSEEHDKYSDLDVITKNCMSAWNFYNVKRSFCLAKKVLLNHENEQDDNQRKLSFNNEDFCADDKNIYRDFTLKLADGDLRSNGIGSKFFGIPEVNEELVRNTKLVNLTSFILAFKYHLNLMSTMQDILCSEQQAQHLEMAMEFLDCFNQTYIVSLRMDRILPLKILLSKIFCLNKDNNMANFINMFKLAFSGISMIFFRYFIKCLGSCQKDHKSAENENYKQLEAQLNEHFQDIKLDGVKDQIEMLSRYFNCFSQHFSMSYLRLNQTSHNFKSTKNFAQFLNEILPENIDKDSILSMLLEFYNPYSKPEEAVATKAVSVQESLDSNDLGYLLKDSQFEYKIWSNEIVNSYVLGLLGEFDKTNESNLDVIFKHYVNVKDKPEWFNSTIKLLAVLVACATTHHGCFEVQPLVKEQTVKLLEDLFFFYKKGSINCVTHRNEE